MKRKRGNKKSKRKGGTEVAGKEAASLVTEDNSGLEEFDNDNNDSAAMEVDDDTPSSTTGIDHLNVVANVNVEDKPVSVGRVKVKLKTSKIMDPQLNSSDAPTQSDTDKSSLQMGLEKQSVVLEKMEDSANSLLQKETASRKPGSIKIKSSNSLGANPSITALNPQGGGNRMPQQLSRPNKKELDSALMVRPHFGTFLRLFIFLFLLQLINSNFSFLDLFLCIIDQ